MLAILLMISYHLVERTVFLFVVFEGLRESLILLFELLKLSLQLHELLLLVYRALPQL